MTLAASVCTWLTLLLILLIADLISLSFASQIWPFIRHYPLFYFGMHFAVIYPILSLDKDQFCRRLWQVSIPLIFAEFLAYLFPHSPSSFLVTALRLSFLITIWFQHDTKRLSSPLVLLALSVRVVASGYLLAIVSFFAPLFIMITVAHVIGIVFTGFFFGIPLTLLYVNWTAYSEFIEKTEKKYDFSIPKQAPIIFVSLLLITISISTKPNTPDIFAQAKLPQHAIPELELETSLLDAYLARNSYLFDYTSHPMQDFYGKHIGLTLDPLFRLLLFPFAYNGVFPIRDEVASIYENYFDRSLEKTHADILRDVIGRPRWQLAAQLTDVDRNAVHLKKQVLSCLNKRFKLKEITITENNDFATIEIHEVFQSFERNQEEVFYYFQMPESAVFTGLWLSDQPNKELAFKHRVSPRGAAQQVYKEQVRSNQDPALLEQVGPKQYRMRVFPILRDVESHLWYTYDVMKINGEWNLPKIVEKRNVYWDYSTLSSLNGQVLDIGSIYNWKGNYLKAKSENSRKTEVSDFEGLKMAVIVDTSYSMRSVKNQLENTLEYIRSKSNKNTIHLFVTTSDNIFKTEEISMNFPLVGFRSNYRMLSQYAKYSDSYDIALLLTDKGSFELSENHKEDLNISHPVYIVHLDEISIGYEDKTLKLLDRGGIATSVQEAMRKYMVKQEKNTRDVDGYIWKVDPSKEPKNAIAAKQMIFNMLGIIDCLKSRSFLFDCRFPDLETVHKLAVRHSLVTPYSSMIVLVNYEQHKLLDELEQKDDKFDREIEDGKRMFQYSFALQLGIPLLFILILVAFVTAL